MLNNRLISIDLPIVDRENSVATRDIATLRFVNILYTTARFTTSENFEERIEYGTTETNSAPTDTFS